MPDRPIVDVLAEVSPQWMAIPGVVLTYESALPDGTPCIKVGVLELTPELEARIPDSAGGHPVVLVETGPVEPR